MNEYKVSYNELGRKKKEGNSSGIFAPKKVFFTLFAILFFGSSFLSMLNISLTSLFSVEEMTIEIGFPFSFLKVGFNLEGSNPLNIKGLILDLVIYGIVSYVINILVNLIKDSLNKNPKEMAKEIKVPKSIN